MWWRVLEVSSAAPPAFTYECQRRRCRCQRRRIGHGRDTLHQLLPLPAKCGMMPLLILCILSGCAHHHHRVVSAFHQPVLATTKTKNSMLSNSHLLPTRRSSFTRYTTTTLTTSLFVKENLNEDDTNNSVIDLTSNSAVSRDSNDRTILFDLLVPTKECNVNQMSGTELAYIGDVVFELYIRSKYIWPQKRTSDLQQKVVAIVRGK